MMINLTDKGIAVEDAARELGIENNEFLGFPGVRFNHNTGAVSGYVSLSEFRFVVNKEVER